MSLEESLRKSTLGAVRDGRASMDDLSDRAVKTLDTATRDALRDGRANLEGISDRANSVLNHLAYSVPPTVIRALFPKKDSQTVMVKALAHAFSPNGKLGGMPEEAIANQKVYTPVKVMRTYQTAGLDLNYVDESGPLILKLIREGRRNSVDIHDDPVVDFPLLDATMDAWLELGGDINQMIPDTTPATWVGTSQPLETTLGSAILESFIQQARPTGETDTKDFAHWQALCTKLHTAGWDPGKDDVDLVGRLACTNLESTGAPCGLAPYLAHVAPLIPSKPERQRKPGVLSPIGMLLSAQVAVTDRAGLPEQVSPETYARELGNYVSLQFPREHLPVVLVAEEVESSFGASVFGDVKPMEQRSRMFVDDAMQTPWTRERLGMAGELVIRRMYPTLSQPAPQEELTTGMDLI